MTTGARAITVLLAVGLLTASAHAGPRAKNLKATVGRKAEKLAVGAKARLGLYRQNQLVVGKTRTFHTAGGGTRTEKTTFEILGRRARLEQVDDETFDARGKRTGAGTIRHGNIRRVFDTIGREISSNLADPDVQASFAGDRAAGERWNTRFRAHEETKGERVSTPHRFVDRKGTAVFIDGASDVQPAPVPRR